MSYSKLALALFVIFIVSCSSEGTKIYKVDYKGNYPEGTFKAVIGNETIFSNGPDILKVNVQKNPNFFCYAINKLVLCSFNVDVELSDEPVKRYNEVTQNLKETVLKSGKKQSTLPQKWAYYVQDNKMEDETIILIEELGKDVNNTLQVNFVGRGINEEASKKDALSKSDMIIRILIDKK